jgi:hypothetical protein
MNGSYLALWLGLWCLTSFATIFSYIVMPRGEAEMHSFSYSNDQILYNQFSQYFLCRVSWLPIITNLGSLSQVGLNEYQLKSISFNYNISGLWKIFNTTRQRVTWVIMKSSLETLSTTKYELLCLNIYTLAYKQSTDIADLYIEIIVNPKERLGD